MSYYHQMTYGFDFNVIIRIKNHSNSRLLNEETPEHRRDTNELIGILEWPDFNSISLLKGVRRNDGSFVFREERLLSGPVHCGWEQRFSTAYWQSGTIITLKNSLHCEDTTDPYCGNLMGSYSHEIKMFGNKIEILNGEVDVQKSKLFYTLFQNDIIV